MQRAEVRAIPTDELGHELGDRDFCILRHAIQNGAQREPQTEPTDQYGVRIVAALERMFCERLFRIMHAARHEHAALDPHDPLLVVPRELELRTVVNARSVDGL